MLVSHNTTLSNVNVIQAQFILLFTEVFSRYYVVYEKKICKSFFVFSFYKWQKYVCGCLYWIQSLFLQLSSPTESWLQTPILPLYRGQSRGTCRWFCGNFVRRENRKNHRWDQTPYIHIMSCNVKLNWKDSCTLKKSLHMCSTSE